MERIYMIKRTHVTKDMGWKGLGNNLGLKIRPIGSYSHKAGVVLRKMRKPELTRRIKQYNKKFHTDFKVL